MNILINNKFHIISIIYICLMAIFIALGVVVYINQYASADHIETAVSDAADTSSNA